MKLRSKILTLTTLMIIFSGLTIALIVKTTLTRSLLTEHWEEGIPEVEHLAHMSANDILTDNKMSLRLMLTEYVASNQDIEYIFIQDNNGDVYVDTFKEGFPSGLKNINILNEMEAYSVQSIKTDKGALTDIVVPIMDGQLGVVHMGISEENITGNVEEVVNMIFKIIIVVLAVGCGLSYVFASVITNPVRKLTELAKEIGSGKMDNAININSKDEIGHLGMTFNKMVKELKNTTVKRDELIKEVSERRKAENNLQQYHNKLELILDSSGEGIYGLDLNGNTTFVNSAAARMIGWDAEELIGRNQHNILHHTRPDGTAYPQEECPIYAVLKDGNVNKVHDEVFWRKDGSSFPVEYISSPMLDTDEKIIGAVVTFMDITERRNAEQELHHMAFYDQLTNLPNRASFISYLGRMLNRYKSQSDYMFAVIFIDLDRFKVINDSLGHIIGDKLLIEVARLLEECTRPTDRISHIVENDRIARFGGDEFALYLHDIKNISSASRVADRIQMKLQKPFIIDGYELFTSASIGIALSTTGYENEEDIIRDADSAMYRAKALGRERAEIFDDEMHARVSQILQLELNLRTALEKDQFMVYYQPIVSATDSRITGAEALIRWNHPQLGFISPMDFIPVAEEIGLISRIGEWVLREACKQNKAWQDAGYQHLLMKVNFSSRQFKDKKLIELVNKVILETGIPAQLLDVEITESIAMEQNSITILKQLTDMGLQTSIDDFGTGYSSLGSLIKFPINTIKIDRVFIKDLTIDDNATAIIKAIIAMAHSLNMEVVAEGVETEEQLAFLQSQKCDKIQGYLFSPPVPEAAFRKLLEQDRIGPSSISKHSASVV